MQNIFFSIIIPTLNEENYIENIISSLEKQTYKNFEVIIVDNGSKDRTVEIIKKIQKKSLLKIILVFCKQRGISYARNYGVKYTKGEFLVFFDTDGYVPKNWLLRANNIFLNNNNIKLLGGIVIFLSKKSIFHTITFNIHCFFGFLCVLLFHIFSGNSFHIDGHNMTIRKENFIKAGGFPNIICEDIGFTQKMLNMYKKRNSIKLTPYLLVYYSARTFEKNGYIKTLIEQLRDYKHKTNPKYYKIYR